MDQTLLISTNDLGTRKVVNIDGHDYTVRKLGAGEDLDVAQITRESITLLEKATSENWGEEEAKQLETLKAKALDIYTRTFDDGGDGSKSRELMSRLSDEERNKLYAMIFPPAYDMDIIKDMSDAVEEQEKQKLDTNEEEIKDVEESPRPS